MRRKELDKEIIVLLLTTLIMVLTWVGFEVYRAYVKTETPADMEKFLDNLDPTIDRVYLDKLNSRDL